MRELNSNINTYYAFQALLQAKLFAPLIALYLTDAVGITLGQVFLLESVGLFLMTLLALPCGAFADQLGKRKALVIGASLMLASDAALALSTTFAMVLLSFCLNAVAFSLIKGPDSALLYSTMTKLGRKGEYKGIEGRSNFYTSLSITVASVLGGLVAAFGLRMTVFASIPISLLCLAAAMRFREPPHVEKRFDIRASIGQITGSISYTIGHSPVLLLMTYTSIVWTAVRISYYVHQQYMRLIGIDYLYLGVLAALFNFTAAFSAVCASKADDRFGTKNTLLFILLLLAASFLLTASTRMWWGAAFILLTHVSRGLTTPLTKYYLNEYIPADKRATILSLDYSTTKICQAGVMALVGWYLGATDVFSVMYATGISILTATVLLFFLYKRLARKK